CFTIQVNAVQLDYQVEFIASLSNPLPEVAVSAVGEPRFCPVQSHAGIGPLALLLLEPHLFEIGFNCLPPMRLNDRDPGQVADDDRGEENGCGDESANGRPPPDPAIDAL